MRYKVKLLAEYHSHLWPNAPIGAEKEFEADKLQQLIADFGKGKLEITPIEETTEEVKESVLSKTLGRLGKK